MARNSTIKLDKFGRQGENLLHLGAERIKYFCDEKTCERQYVPTAKGGDWKFYLVVPRSGVKHTILRRAKGTKWRIRFDYNASLPRRRS